jgi:hypothetical protein
MSLSNPSSEVFLAETEQDVLYKLGLPGAFHQKLEPLIGDWKVELTVFTDPSAPVKSEGLSSRKEWVMGRRHIKEEFLTGTLAGMQYGRLTLLGYNSVNGRYELTSIDNLDTHNQRYEGQSDESGQIITLYGTYTQAVMSDQVGGDGVSRATSGVHPAPRRTLAGVLYNVRSVLTIQNDDQHLHQFYFRPATGEEGLAFQFAYNRQ